MTSLNGHVTAPAGRALELADDIRGHHKAVERHGRAMLDEAIVAGLKLIEAKELVRHGEWGAYLAYCGVPARSAQVYMKVAREKRSAAVIEADSIRTALKALAGPPPEPKKEFPYRRFPARNRRWQLDAWVEAMAAGGRVSGERRQRVHDLRRHFRPNGDPRFGTTEEDAKRFTKSFLCPVCHQWHIDGPMRTPRG